MRGHGTLADGFGNEWPKCSDECRIEIVRPGKARCDCEVGDSGNLQHAVYAWLGACRDRMQPGDVESLQRILGPLSSSSTNPNQE